MTWNFVWWYSYVLGMFSDLRRASCMLIFVPCTRALVCLQAVAHDNGCSARGNILVTPVDWPSSGMKRIPRLYLTCVFLTCGERSLSERPINAVVCVCVCVSVCVSGGWHQNCSTSTVVECRTVKGRPSLSAPLSHGGTAPREGKVSGRGKYSIWTGGDYFRVRQF